MAAETNEDDAPGLPSRMRKGRLPKFDPTADELEEGLREVEHLLDEVASTDEDELEPPPLDAVKYMVMRADGTLVEVSDGRPKKASLDAEALGEEMAGFFDALEGGDEAAAEEDHHQVPVVHLQSDGVAQLDLDVFAQIVERRVPGLSLVEGAAAIEELLKAVQVLGSEQEPAFEVYLVDGATLRGVYPVEGRAIRDGAPLMSARSQRGATGKFLKDGQKYNVSESAVLCQDVLGKFFVTQKNTITAHPEPAVAGISIDEMRATLLEGRFKGSIVRSMMQGKRIVGIGLHGKVAMVFRELNPLSTVCDRGELKGLFEILADVYSRLEE